MKLLLSPQLHPLTTLVGGAFVNAWLESVKGHYLLWIHGIQSGDPSLLNMKHCPDVEGGVLVDYDLSIHATSARNRKGTTPFMALELLADRY
ncbi:hypothetical protein Hypma_002246 [Hypsizygus marmoreus]|uniref:Uncharacterized protein n=1 Tax=Hypsizygus marmoreus TaxID=39966 RepID=A0A369K083_HYPMA|nr:hypothetical protein Hypma_002246 [Hypsizygus marmoreus]